MALKPENRIEQILAGENITPENRMEAFTKEAIDNAGGGGADLPTPGTAGNVLTSTGDGWESAEPSGGELVCNFTIDGQGNISCDKRVSAILDAIANDRPIVGSFNEGDRVNYLIVVRTTESMVTLQMVDTVSNRRFAINNVYGTIGDPSDTWVLEPKQYETNAPLIIPGSISDTTATSFSETPLADIYSAFDAGRPVYFEANVGNGRGRFACTSVELNAGVYTVVYAAPMIVTGKPAVYEIKFSDSDTTGTATVAVAS